MTLTAISPLFATRIFSSLQVALRAPPLGLNFRFTCATFVLGVHSFGKLPTLPTMKPHDVALISLAGLTKKPWFEERKTRGEKEEMKQNAWEIIGSWRGLTRGELTDLQTVMESILRQKETEDKRRKKLNRENGSQFKLENTQYRPNLPRTTQEKRIRRGGRRPRERIPSHRGDPSDLSLPEGKTSGLGDARARLICEEADEGRFDEFEARGGGGGGATLGSPPESWGEMESGGCRVCLPAFWSRPLLPLDGAPSNTSAWPLPRHLPQVPPKLVFYP